MNEHVFYHHQRPFVFKKLGQATFFDFCISVKIGPSTPYILESVENVVCLEQTQNRVIDS
jgi:hypothetical protein